jgi:hypothetical protein
MKTSEKAGHAVQLAACDTQVLISTCPEVDSCVACTRHWRPCYTVDWSTACRCYLLSALRAVLRLSAGLIEL